MIRPDTTKSTLIDPEIIYTTTNEELNTFETKDKVEIKLVSDFVDHIIVEAVTSTETDKDVNDISTEVPADDEITTTDTGGNSTQEKTGRSLEEEPLALTELKELQEMREGQNINFREVYRSSAVLSLRTLCLIYVISFHLLSKL